LKLENPIPPVTLASLTPSKNPLKWPRQLLALLTVVLFLLLLLLAGKAQGADNTNSAHAKRVLLIFGDARDLPGNVMQEHGLRSAMLANSDRPIEFFAESLDASHFSNAQHYRFFQDYIKNKYTGQNLDLIVLFMARDFRLAEELPSTLVSNVPTIFVVPNELPLPDPPGGRPFTGVFQHFDVSGTLQFILRLQPQTRRVVVIGGRSQADQIALSRIAETAHGIEGVNFEFWTNQPVAEFCHNAQSLTQDTVVLLATVQRDAAGESFYTSHVVQMLAPSASVPVYVLAAALVGSGAVGGNVIDLEALGGDAGKLAAKALSGISVTNLPIVVRTNGVPMADWRALQRWNIKEHRLPADCIIAYRPTSLWETHRRLILFVGAILVAQAMTITGLLVQRSLRRQAEAELLKQRTALAHAGRVSRMGQLASALTHELNQPLGAILRNAEAGELYLQANPPNLKEVHAILADIRRDDKRAGNVIDRMRSLLKRQKLSSTQLDLREVVEDTIAMIQPDAETRQVRLKVDMPATLVPAQGDRVHVQQVLLNLIFNGMDAMSHTPKQKRLLIVRARETKNGNLQVTVTDQGVGIPQDAVTHIFEPFYTTKSNGMGMGLAISRTIIEAHGGELWMESQPTVGTTFTFILPPAGLDKVRDGDLPVA